MVAAALAPRSCACRSTASSMRYRENCQLLVFPYSQQADLPPVTVSRRMDSRRTSFRFRQPLLPPNRKFPSPQATKVLRGELPRVSNPP